MTTGPVELDSHTRRAFLARSAALGIAGAAWSCTTVPSTDTAEAVAAADETPPPATPESADSAAAEPAAPPRPVPERRVLGANDRIQCGFIGVGNRGSALLRAVLARPDVDVVAVADTYDVWRDRALRWCKEEVPKARDYVDFRRMIEREELDAVVIATPDHIHAPALEAALEAGCDVYCEKPLTLLWEDAARLRDRAVETGAVVQVGTQLRSLPMYRRARELVQSGTLGDIVVVQVNRDFNRAVIAPQPPPAEANPSNVHWDLFLEGTPEHPFDTRRYFRWREFREYSNGFFGDLMLHHLDMCHFVTGCGSPRRVVAMGGIYAFDDGRTCPDTVSALVEYDRPIHFNFSSTGANGHYGLVERYLGTKGTLEIRNMAEMSIYLNEIEEKVPSEGLLDDPHVEDFFACMRSRAETTAPIDAGVDGAAAAHMAILSQTDGRAYRWDGTQVTPA